MNPKLFSEAMSEVNDKYYEEAANYQCKNTDGENGVLRQPALQLYFLLLFLFSLIT